MTIWLLGGLTKRIKKISLYKMGYYPKPYSYSRNKIKIELKLSNSATKPEVNKANEVDPSELAKLADSVSLQSDVDKLDTDKLKHCPTDQSKVSIVVDNDVLEKTNVINWLKNSMLLVVVN